MELNLGLISTEHGQSKVRAITSESEIMAWKYSLAIHAILKTPEELQHYLLQNQPDDYDKTMPSRGIASNDRMGYVNQIGDDWQQSSSAKNQRKSSTSKTSNGTKIQLRLIDDQRPNILLSFDIESDTTLKTLFNDYAEKRDVSLRSLRFSYNSKTLFLSSAGNKTPDELSMRDQDIINVYDTNAVQEAKGESLNQNTKANKKVNSKKKKKTNGKNKKKQQIKHHEKDTLTLEDFKALHSQTLTKLHEEAEPQLKEIRMRLNTLDLERQPRKQKKSKHQKKPKQGRDGVDYRVLPSFGIGGKAGKPYFSIHVGEVSNLYKTTKPSQKHKGSSSTSSSAMATLDLHGFTQEKALQKLDESLITWVDAAMRGSYPFTIPAKIVCGCGNQVLSEVVEKWIHEHDQVANSPKGQQC